MGPHERSLRDAMVPPGDPGARSRMGGDLRKLADRALRAARALENERDVEVGRLLSEILSLVGPILVADAMAETLLKAARTLDAESN